MDRQHPRHLFDIKLLFENDGLADGVRKAFIVYLISQDRPMIELLNSGLKDIKLVFENEFAGMTNGPVEMNDLLKTRDKLIKQIKELLTDEEIKFIISFKNGSPEWERLGLNGLSELPAVAWELFNLNKMNPEKHKKTYKKLKRFLVE